MVKYGTATLRWHGPAYGWTHPLLYVGPVRQHAGSAMRPAGAAANKIADVCAHVVGMWGTRAQGLVEPSINGRGLQPRPRASLPPGIFCNQAAQAGGQVGRRAGGQAGRRAGRQVGRWAGGTWCRVGTAARRSPSAHGRMHVCDGAEEVAGAAAAHQAGVRNVAPVYRGDPGAPSNEAVRYWPCEGILMRGQSCCVLRCLGAGLVRDCARANHAATSSGITQAGGIMQAGRWDHVSYSAIHGCNMCPHGESGPSVALAKRGVPTCEQCVELVRRTRDCP
jgi:hypothetical protein